MPRTWVFAAGISAYKDGRFSLKYAHKDAKAIADFFKSEAGGRVPEGRVTQLVDGEATRENILSAIEEIAKRSDGDDMIVLFLSMHATGIPGEPFYFLAHNTDPTRLLATGIKEDDLKGALAKARAKRVVMLLDTCHAGSFGFSDLAGKKALRAEETGRLLRSLAALSERGTGVLAAAGQNEYSEEDARWGGGHGVFTYHMLSGLQGGADEDRDGVIMLRELYDYVYDRVKKDRNKQQHPDIKGNGRLPLVRVASSPAPAPPPVVSLPPAVSSTPPAPLPALPPAGAAGMKRGECPSGMVFVRGGDLMPWWHSERKTVPVGSFCVDSTEVTVGAYEECGRRGQCSVVGLECDYVGANFKCGGPGARCKALPGRQLHPVNCVTWADATSFCTTAGKRLLTSDEWEWVARQGPSARTYPWGEAFPDYQLCWSGVFKRGGTCSVAGFPAGDSPEGVHDLAGNVREWVAAQEGPNSFVARGNGWDDVGPHKNDRFWSWLTYQSDNPRSSNIGFRCAKTPVEHPR